MAELCDWGPPAPEEGLTGRRLHNFGSTDPVHKVILGQIAHFHLVNQHQELVLCETVLYMVDKNSKYFSGVTIISGLFIYYLIGCLPQFHLYFPLGTEGLSVLFKVIHWELKFGLSVDRFLWTVTMAQVRSCPHRVGAKQIRLCILVFQVLISNLKNKGYVNLAGFLWKVVGESWLCIVPSKWEQCG